MKIAIVGAGISGLATYLFLRKNVSDVELSIYEKHDMSAAANPPSSGGSGVTIFPNGLRILSELDSDLASEIYNHGDVRHKLQFRSAKGRDLGSLDLGGLEGPDYCVSITRQKLWRCLLKAVEEKNIVQSRVTAIREGPVVVADNGKEESVHLVIGADGIHSITRATLFSRLAESKSVKR